VFLAAGTVLAQAAPDLTTLERKLEDARAALTRAEALAAPAERSSFGQELQDLQDEVAYVRVKSRRGETLSDRELRDLATRLDRFTTRVNALAVGHRRREIPVGTEIDVRLQTPLSSKTAVVEQRVEATTLVPLQRGEDVLVPAGSLLVGHVAAVEKATRTNRTGRLSLQFTNLSVPGRTAEVRASVTEALKSEGLKGEAGKIAVGSAAGAILGGILGGTKGALAGILVGGGGVLVATEGKDVELASGAVLRVRFDSAVPLEK
jgi:type IV secretory pathway VirB10-like protein